MDEKKKIYIIGAGPAGLSAAYYALKYTDYIPVIFEKSQYIGGISRTHIYNENRMDLGGHRFFTKNNDVLNLWKEIFPVQEMPAIDDIILKRVDKFKSEGVNPEKDEDIFLKRKRISRIYFNKKFFDYPISFKLETFLNLGFVNLIKCGLYYLFSCVKKSKENSLEDFYINRFGKALYENFFENYTEKLWGVHPSKLDSSWGVQRVKGLSLLEVVKNAILKPFVKTKETSLIEEFYYPKYGPGQFYEALAEKIKTLGGEVHLNSEVVKIIVHDNKINALEIKNSDNENVRYETDLVFSSMPIKDLICAFDNKPDDNISNIAENLPYRDFMTVGLLMKNLKIKNMTKYKTVSDIIPDCWIYIQESDVKIGRLQIFNNWSPYLLKDLENTVWLGLEYFCNENDEMWNMQDEKFIDFAISELEKIGFIDKLNVIDSTLVRVKKAYPAYFGVYKDFDKLKTYLNSIENLYCIGRNGQHRYNNMDHSILTGLQAIKILSGKASKSSVWDINTEKEYHEKSN